MFHYNYTYKLDGDFFIVEDVFLDEDGAIIVRGHYLDGIWDEARVEDLEISSELIIEEE